MDYGPLDMLQLMHTVYAIPPAPVEPIAPVPFVPGDFSDMWCRNPDGDKVEWWVIYKVPAGTMSKDGRDEISNGAQYGYIDSASKLDHTVSFDMFADITSTEKNALYNTLDVLFKYPREFMLEKNLTLLAYNDRPPAEVSNSSTNGIAKGVLLFGANSGAWISHTFESFGHFFQEKFIFPAEARRQAQSAICMSLNMDNWDKIVSHLRRESPNIYDWNIAPAMFDSHPALKQLIEKNFNHDEPGAESNVLTGVNGTDFIGLSKNAVHNFDIFETLVAPHVESNIFLRGAPDGDQRLENFCNDFNISEIEEVELKLKPNVTFKNVRLSHDNSRWAVSERDYWVCLGSVERRKSHFPRGAEAFCFQNQPASILLANSIGRFSSCKKLPDDIIKRIAAAPAGTAVDVGSNGTSYVRPIIVRPSSEIPRVYYGGLPSVGLPSLPFKKILKNPLVVGAAVAGVMHYRHKNQIRKLKQMHALQSGYASGPLSGYGGGFRSPSFFGGGSSVGAYSSGLAGLVSSHHGGSGYHGAPVGGYNPLGAGGYPAPGGGYHSGYPAGGHNYPAPGGYHSPTGGYPAPGGGYPPPGVGGYPHPAGVAGGSRYPAPGGYSAPQQHHQQLQQHGYPSNPGAYAGSSAAGGAAGGYPRPGYGGYPTAPGSHAGSHPSAPASSYPTQPSYNPTFNAAKPASASAPSPSAPTAQSVPKQRAGAPVSARAPPALKTARPAGYSAGGYRRPVKVEKTVTKTVTSYGPSSSRSSGSGSRRSGHRSSSGGRRGGSRG